MLDPIDKKIVETLQKQGRITNVDLARMNDLAPSSMLERVRRLEERSVITGYRAEVNPKLLGYQVQAMVAINLDRHQAGPIDVFENKIRSIPEVMACYHVTGRYDYMVDVAVRDIDHLGDLIKHTLAGIAGVEKQETFLVLSTVKENHGYSLECIVSNG
jgi:Lrp/AsnC family leucine-responsive transcriptional regulator